jgi:hypothetical protein
MLSPASSHPARLPHSAIQLDRNQEKGPKFDAFFATAVWSLTRRSRAAARNCDQKR